MSRYTREPNFKDFQEWVKEDQGGQAYDFYNEYILPLILELEQDDYFGTEGFDKRYG